MEGSEIRGRVIRDDDTHLEGRTGNGVRELGMGGLFAEKERDATIDVKVEVLENIVFPTTMYGY